MAISLQGGITSAARPSAATTFTINLLTEMEWNGDGPAAGDIIVLEVIKPAISIVAPSGWTAFARSSCWKLWDGKESLAVTFTAPHSAAGWEIQAICASPSEGKPFGETDTASTIAYPQEHYSTATCENRRD